MAYVKIGIDVDEVTAEYLDGFLAFLKRVDPNQFQHLRREHFRHYSLCRAMRWQSGYDREQEYNDQFSRSPEYLAIAPVDGSVESVRHLAGKHELHAVTLRRNKPHVVSSTEEWISRHYDGAIDGRVHVIGNPEGFIGLKGEYCARLGISLMIEDQPRHAKDIADHGMPVVLFDRLWNEGMPETSMIRRAKGWNEVEQLAGEMEVVRC